MHKINHHASLAEKRRLRVRGKLHGTAERPRVSVFRSNRFTYVQAINDDQGVTVASVNDVKAKTGAGTKLERATKMAQDLAGKLQKSGISKAVLDRGAYRYHGRVKAIADGLRTAGVEV